MLLLLLFCFFGGFVCSWYCGGFCVAYFFFPKTVHVLLFIFYNNVLEAGNWLLIQRASCFFLLSNIDFWFSPLFFFFLIFFSLQGTSQHSFPLFYASLINDAIICHQHRSRPSFFRKTCQHREHKLCSFTAIGHKCNRSIHKLWLLFVCFSFSWQQHNG